MNFFSVLVAQTVGGIMLTMDETGAVTARFESTTTLTVKAESSILSVTFSGDTDSLRGVAKGLLGKNNLGITYSLP